MEYYALYPVSSIVLLEYKSKSIQRYLEIAARIFKEDIFNYFLCLEDRFVFISGTVKFSQVSMHVQEDIHSIEAMDPWN